MKQTKMWQWARLALLAIAVSTLSACLEIKSKTKVESDAKIMFSTTYDLSKSLPTLQRMSKEGKDLAEDLSCERMNEKLAKELACKDIAPGKFIISGEFVGDFTRGVDLNKDKNKITVDAVQLFKIVTNLNFAKGASIVGNDYSKAMQNSFMPENHEQAEVYKQMGIVLELDLTMPADVLTVDGVLVKDSKDNTVSINFIDLAGKDTYFITSLRTNNVLDKMTSWFK